jgi:hypothetical protein
MVALSMVITRTTYLSLRGIYVENSGKAYINTPTHTLNSKYVLVCTVWMNVRSCMFVYCVLIASRRYWSFYCNYVGC